MAAVGKGVVVGAMMDGAGSATSGDVRSRVVLLAVARVINSAENVVVIATVFG